LNAAYGVAVIAVCTVAAALLTARAPAAQGRGGAVAIRGGTVLTVTRGTISNGTVLIQNGRIAAVGTNVVIPAGAEIVDATGRFVSPGIIDCHSHIAADSLNESGTTVSSMTGIEDVFNPADVDIYWDLAGGLTTANVLHGSANPIGGKNFVVKLRWGKTRAEDFAFAGAPPGIKFALGENPKRPGGGAGRQAPTPARFPATRMGVEYVIRDAFTRAKAYQQAWQDYNRRKQAGEDVVPPRRDLQLEPLVEVLEGKRLVHAHSYRADEILMLIRVAEEFGFKIATFQHVLEGYKVAKEIAAHGAGASTFADWWGYKLEAVDAIPYNAAIMARKGVLVSINSDSAEFARRLNTEAAKTMKWGGLSADEALALVTINPAKQLRIDSRVGSLEAGKDADVVIWNHHPLSSYAIADRVYIDGEKYYDRLEDAARVTKLEQDKKALVEAERGRGPSNQPQAPTAEATSQGDLRTDGGGAVSTQSGAVVAQAGAAVAPGGAAAGAGAGTRAVEGGGSLVIINAHIFPIAQPAIERGAIIVRNGRIEAVGANLSIPSGARLVDAEGAEVYPGFIDARTTLGLSEPGAGGFGDVDEILDFNPQLRSQTAYHNDSEAIPVARANGITTVAVTPAGGIFGGQIAVMDLDGVTWEESTLAPSVGVAFQFPTIPRRPAAAPGQPRAYVEAKRDRDRRIERAAQQLEAARAYAKRAAGSARDLVLEALVPIVERRMPLFTRADSERDIRDAVAFAERTGVRIVISGGAEAQFVAPLLAEHHVPVILNSVLTLPSREDLPHQASYAVAGQLAAAGVKIAFSAGDTDDVENVRELPYDAARSVAWGLPRDAALRALTIDAAEILGISDRAGSIEPGKIANLLVSQGDPLEVATTISHVIVNGRDVSLDDRQLALYQRYVNRP
jgi:imidazolonepropionase-like amidohydrolase